MSDRPRSEIWRWQSGTPPRRDTDELANEEPLEIRVDDRAVSITMRTPGHDTELAGGFLLSEGLVRGRADLRAVAPVQPEPSCNIVNVDVTPGACVDFARLTRHVFASSSCGLCGKATIEAVHQHFPPVTSDLVIDASVLLSLPSRGRAAQAVFDRTGGLHAAALFDQRGELVILREDVGRHNAVDKVLGYALLNGLLPLNRHVLLVSGRSSFEIMQKALAGRIPIIAAISAPSTLAVRFAQESGQTLIGFLRGPRMNVYTMPQRIRFP
ncbi:MAG TPA: formate dehydrogenase accessory sulfurtransferase FdhD [Candidatus Kryptonia bacterium]|nr:formate dehydrogenase accessory sulfurtransferase FdhD [Candidatus Kryptonia bacterium]